MGRLLVSTAHITRKPSAHGAGGTLTFANPTPSVLNQIVPSTVVFTMKSVSLQLPEASPGQTQCPAILMVVPGTGRVQEPATNSAVGQWTLISNSVAGTPAPTLPRTNLGNT